jgi:hypothetical protein
MSGHKISKGVGTVMSDLRGLRTGAAAAALTALLTVAIWPGESTARTSAVKNAPRVCLTAFPSAKTTRLGRTVFYNRQASVQYVVCYEFGLHPSADFPMTGDVACGVLSSVLGGFTKTARLALWADGSCSAVSLAGDPRSPARWLSRVCGWASDLLGVATVKVGGVISGLACTLAPSAGTSLGSLFESKHELDVAQDIVQHGKCLKYSPSHFGSAWLAIACARSDKGFSTLPPAGAGYSTVRACQIQGGLVDVNQTIRLQGAVTVTMPYATSSAIAAKLRPGEFGAPTTANDIPCDVGQFVAEQALNAGVAGNVQASVDGMWTGEAGSYDLGAFACASTDTYPWHDTCVHSADAAAGQVSVRFDVVSNVD